MKERVTRPTVLIGEGAPRQLLPVLPTPDGIPDWTEGGTTDLETDGRKPLRTAVGPEQIGIGIHAKAANSDSYETCVTDGKDIEIDI